MPSLFPELRLTSKHAIPHCLRPVGDHWYAEPVDVDIGGKADDAEGKEYGKLEEDPRLRFGSPLVPFLLDVLTEI